MSDTLRGAVGGPYLGGRRETIVPSVSIGMPVYNGERFIEGAIESILTQTYTDFELIISDNASTDRTEEICLAYVRRDPRVRYLRNEQNLGAAENYNRLFAESAGRYFKWAAHDDLCRPTFVERCVEVLDREEDVVLSYPKSIFIDEEGRELAEYAEDVDYADPRAHRRLRAWLMDRPGGWCNLVFGVVRSEALRQTGLIGKYVASDYVLIAELVLLGKVRQLPEHLFLRRDHPGRSAVAHRGPEKTTLWFDSSARTGRVYFPHWRRLRGYLNAAGRTRIGFAEKLRAVGVVLRWAARARHHLMADLSRGMGKMVHGRRSGHDFTG